MDLKTAKVVAFALEAESFLGVMAKGPGELLAISERYDRFETLEELWAGLSKDVAAKLRNYELVWAKRIAGLSPQLVPAPEAEAKIDDFVQSAKSESVSIETSDVGSIDDVLGRQQTLGEPT